MSGVVVNGTQFISALDRYEQRFQKMFRNKVRRLVTEGMDRLLRRTPVNTGQAVASYVASRGAPNPKVAAPRKPVEATNQLPIGRERLRAGAEAEARATLATLDFSDPYAAYYITNAAPHISGLETGSLPAAPYRPRSPAGMFGVTVQELLTLLSSRSI